MSNFDAYLRAIEEEMLPELRSELVLLESGGSIEATAKALARGLIRPSAIVRGLRSLSRPMKAF